MGREDPHWGGGRTSVLPKWAQALIGAFCPPGLGLRRRNGCGSRFARLLGMTLNETQTAAARATLLQRRDAINRIQQQNANDGAALRNDTRERASSEEIAQVLVKLSDRERVEVDAIDAALARMDKGTWGTCGSCGKKIGGPRMAAMPEATQCLPCAAEAGASQS